MTKPNDDEIMEKIRKVFIKCEMSIKNKKKNYVNFELE